MSELSEPPPVDKNLKVHLRFLMEPFEIGLETESKESEVGATVARLVGAVQTSQEKMTSAISSVDTSKFGAIRRRRAIESEDPLERVADKLKVDLSELIKIILIDKGKVFITCKREAFGARGPGEKAVLVMLYVYKYGLEKSPSHDEINEAYEKLNFKPRGFGVSVKSNLIHQRRISEDKKTHAIAIEPRAIPEAEDAIRKILTKA